MHPDEFKHYSLRVDMDVALRYNDLTESIIRIVHRLAHDESHPTVIHVHINVPMDQTAIPGERIQLYQMPGLVGLMDVTQHCKTTFHTEIAESYITDCHGQPLRRLDIHFNDTRRQYKTS